MFLLCKPFASVGAHFAVSEFSSAAEGILHGSSCYGAIGSLWVL